MINPQSSLKFLDRGEVRETLIEASDEPDLP